MTEPTKALSCPFCGSARIGVHKYKQRRAVGFRARCLNCGMSQLGMCHGDHEQAIAAWNNRTPQPTQAQAGAVPLTPFIPVQRERLFYNRPENAGKGLVMADWHRVVQYVEAAHGIKGGQHDADN
ncbi:MAG: Lar family restriction alleviation protein [Acidovorax sp.]|nr:Lar family restriction alleviation protein [Acidovorax sp.]